jgi:hypothetical protein
MQPYSILAAASAIVGINPDIAEEILADPQAPPTLTDGNNILIKNGRIEKLKGTDYLNNISTQLGTELKRNVLGVPIYRKFSTGAKYLMSVLPEKLYYLKNDTEWYNLGDISGGLNDSIFTFGNIEDKFIFTVSDSAYIYCWNGTDFSKLFSPPDDENRKARFVLPYKLQLFLIRIIENDTENFQTIWPSEAGDITSFNANMKLRLDAEGMILNAKRLEDNIIVYFDTSVHQVSYDSVNDTYLGIPIFSGFGIYAPKTLTGNKDVHFFLAKEGLMRYVKSEVPVSVSNKRFNKFILDTIDPVYYYRATARFFPHLNFLFLSFPKSGSSQNDVQLIFDAHTNQLISKKVLTVENYASYGEFEKDLSGLSPDERKLYGLSVVPIIGTADGYIKEQKITSYQDGVDSYESNGVFPPFNCRQPDKNKRCMQINLEVEKLTDSDITFGIDLANEANENYGYQFTLKGTGNKGIRKYELRTDDNGVNVDCLGKTFRMRIKDIANNEGWNFRAVYLLGYFLGQR